MLVLTDPEYRILWANERAQGAFAPLDELLGRHCYEAIGGHAAPCPGCVVAKGHATGQAASGELREVAENGRPLTFHVNATPILDDDGNIVAWLEATTGLNSIDILRLESERLQIILSMQESERRFESLAGVAPVGIVIMVDGKIAWANARFAEIVEATVEEVRNSDPIAYLDPEYRPVVAERLNVMLKQRGRMPMIDVPGTSFAGNPLTLSATSTYCVYRGRDATMTVLDDVTERRRLLDESEKRRQELQALTSISQTVGRSLALPEVLETALDEVQNAAGCDAAGISIVDHETGIIRMVAHRNIPEDISRHLAAIPISQSWSEEAVRTGTLVTVLDVASDPHSIAETQEHGFTEAICVPLKSHDRVVGVLDLASKTPGWGSSVSEGFLLSMGAQIGMALANAQLYEQVAASEEHYRTLFETIPDPVVFAAFPEGRLLYCNSVFREQLGYTDAELASMHLEDLVVPADYRAAAAVIAPKLRDKSMKTEIVKARVLRGDGSAIHAEARVSLYRNSDRARGLQVLIRDVTNEKLLQDQMIRAEKLSALGQLVSGVAHELNNPLATILLAAEMLAKKETDPDKRERLDAIIKQVQRSTALTEDLRVFARRDEPQSRLVDVADVVNSVNSLVAAAFKREKMEIVTEFSAERPLVLGDMNQLEQVFLNLMNNARQAMRDQPGDNRLTIRISSGCESAVGLGRCVRIAISDTGPGIPEAARNRIFDPFFTTKPPDQGTGLGLSVSLSIVESHGGSIYLDESSTGATFLVELPAADPGEMARERGVLADKRLTSELDGVRILIIDDEEAIVNMLREMLETVNCDVTCAYTVEDGLQHTRDQDYDVVLCDLKMAPRDGIDCLKSLRQEAPHMADRLVFMSGDTGGVEIYQMLQGVPNLLLEKPFTYRRLLSAVSEVLQRAG